MYLSRANLIILCHSFVVSVTCSYTLKGVENFPKFTNKKGEKHINNFTQASKLIDVVLKTIKSSSI